MVYESIKPVVDYISNRPDIAIASLMGLFLGGLTLGGKLVYSGACKKLQKQRAHEEYTELTGSLLTSTAPSETLEIREKFQM